MLGAARLAVPLVFHNSANTFQAPRSETDTESHRASQGSGQRGPPARRGRKRPPPARPAASRRLGVVTIPGVSGTYVTPRGRRRCCCFPLFPKTNSFPRAPNSLSALGQASARRRRFPPRVLPAPPLASLPAGRGAAPAPGGTAEPSAASHRGAPSPQAAPDSQHGRERAAGVPAEKGSARKVSLSLPGRPRPKPSPGAQNAAGQRCSPGTPRSGRRLPYPPHGRGHTPHAVGRAPGHRPAGRGRRHLGREGRAARPRLPVERPERAARPGPRVAPRGSGRLQAPDLPPAAFLRDVLCGRSRVCVRARGSKYARPEVIQDGHVFKHFSLRSTWKGISNMFQSEELLVSLEKLWQKGSHQKHLSTQGAPSTFCIRTFCVYTSSHPQQYFSNLAGSSAAHQVLKDFQPLMDGWLRRF